MTDASPHIGTLGEKPLHAALKRWCHRPGDLIESPVDGYVIDLVRGDLLIEVQTGGFASMKRKLEALLASGHRIRIVTPVAVDKWVVKIDADGAVIDRRKSPKHEGPADVFSRLVSIPDLLASSDLEIEIVHTEQEELRVHHPGKAWRRGGWIVAERRLDEVIDSTFIEDPTDLLRLLPDGLVSPFTTADWARSAGVTRRVAQQGSYCLRNLGLLKIVGKQGNALQYEIA